MVETIILEDYTPNRQLINAATKLGNVKRGQKFTLNIHNIRPQCYFKWKYLKINFSFIPNCCAHGLRHGLLAQYKRLSRLPTDPCSMSQKHIELSQTEKPVGKLEAHQVIITKLGHEFTLEFRGVGHLLNLLYCVTRKIGRTFFCCVASAPEL